VSTSCILQRGSVKIRRMSQRSVVDSLFRRPAVSGAGTNLKVGAPVRRKAPEKKFFLVVPLHFFDSKSTISRFAERFRDGQYSLVSFLFAVFLLMVPPCPAICKSGGKYPRAPWSRRHCPHLISY